MSPKKLRIDHPLDEQYQALYDMALSVAEAYLAHANSLIEQMHDRKLHTHMLISVRIKTPGCWTATWAKKVMVKDTKMSGVAVQKLRAKSKAVAGEVLTVDLPKGEGFSYKASTFNSLPRELREVALLYERLLADLRKAGQENRSLRRSLDYHAARTNKILGQCNASLDASRLLRNAIYSDAPPQSLPE
jgi:hypothetical protein